MAVTQFNNDQIEFWNFRFISNALEEIEKRGLRLSPTDREQALKKWGFEGNVLDFLKDLTYNSKDTLENMLNRLQTEITKIEMGGETKKERMIITSDERGVFSFGLASKGLFKPIEYFSEQLALDLPKEFPNTPSGIVPPNEVKTKLVFNQRQFWYHSPTNDKDYQLEQQQEGTREVDLGLRTNKIFRTSTKKSYVLLPKKSGKAKMVDVFVPLHGSVSLQNIVPMFLAIINLEKQGIRTKVTSVRMVQAHYSPRRWTACAIGVKDYTEPLDIYQVARKTDSGAWWSCMFGILSYLEDYYMAGNSPNGEPEYVDLFKRWKNWFFDQIKKGKADPLRVSKELMIFGYNEDTSDSGMIEGYFKIMDIVEFQFQKEEYCLERIYRRVVDYELAKYVKEDLKPQNLSPDKFVAKKKQRKKELVDNFKKYCTKIWLETYHSAERGVWSDSTEEKKRLSDLRAEKLDKLIKFLQTKS